jgi:hypothetical protein
VGLLAQLEQHTPGRGRMQKGDKVAARTGPRRLVDQTDARRLERLQGAAQILHLEADMV